MSTLEFWQRIAGERGAQCDALQTMTDQALVDAAYWKAEARKAQTARNTLDAQNLELLAALRVAYRRLDVLEGVVANQSRGLWADMRTVEAAIKAAEGK